MFPVSSFSNHLTTVLVKLLSALAPLTPKPLFKDYPEGGEVRGVVNTKTGRKKDTNKCIFTSCHFQSMQGVANSSEREKEKREATPAGSACQNTSMSTNWVIFDMRMACQRIDGGAIGKPRACEGRSGALSKHAQALPPADNLAQAGHCQAREHLNTGPAHPAAVGGMQFVTWASLNVSKRRDLIQTCSMKLAVLYQFTPARLVPKQPPCFLSTVPTPHIP